MNKVVIEATESGTFFYVNEADSDESPRWEKDQIPDGCIIQLEVDVDKVDLKVIPKDIRQDQL